MSDLRKAAQALLEAWSQPNGINYYDFAPYIEALRAALAQPEPVWVQGKPTRYVARPPIPPQRQPEPVMFNGLTEAETNATASVMGLTRSEPEPVAYPEGDVVGPCVCGSWPGGKCLKCPRIAPPQRQSEPVAWWNGKESVVFTHDEIYTPNWTDYWTRPLYAHPPQRQPLTEEIEKIINDNTDGDGMCAADDLLAAIRARDSQGSQP